MNTTLVNEFFVIGIATKTTNEDSKSASDIPQLWNRFFSENIFAKIPNKIEETIYCFYTDYEKDFTKPYTTIIGCKVDSLDLIPEGFVGKRILGGNYKVFTTRGNMNEGIVFQEWMNIWNSNISRVYSTDFEVYGEKAQDPENAEIDIFVAVN